MTLNEILGRLRGVRGGNGQYTAKCPAHDDRNASLSVGVGNDRRILLKCHAGCSSEAITAALGGDCVAVVADNSVDVVVSGGRLNDDAVLQINDIIRKVCGAQYENVRISAAN